MYREGAIQKQACIAFKCKTEPFERCLTRLGAVGHGCYWTQPLWLLLFTTSASALQLGQLPQTPADTLFIADKACGMLRATWYVDSGLAVSAAAKAPALQHLPTVHASSHARASLLCFVQRKALWVFAAGTLRRGLQAAEQQYQTAAARRQVRQAEQQAATACSRTVIRCRTLSGVPEEAFDQTACAQPVHYCLLSLQQRLVHILCRERKIEADASRQLNLPAARC